MEIPKSLQNINLKSVLRSRGIYKVLEENSKLKAGFKPIAKKMFVKPKPIIPPIKISKSFSNEIITDYVNKRIHTIEVVEKKFENKLNQFIDFVQKGFMRNLNDEINNKDFVKFIQKDYFDDNEDEFLTKAQFDFTPLLENLAVISGNEANKLIGVKEPYLPFDYRQKIINNVNKFTKSMLDTDRDHLINVITQGLETGKSNIEIRDAIEADFGEYSMNQARRITTTEVARVSQQAAVDAYEQSGVVEELQWVIFGASDECADYDGEVRSLDDNGFYDVQNEFQDGDPPLHPNCKCQLVPIVVGTEPTYVPDNKSLRDRIVELESQIDKRTKEFKELKSENSDSNAYIKSLEKYLGVGDES